MLETLKTLLQYYPLGLSDTLVILGMAYGALKYLINKQWDKLADHIQKESLPLFEQYMSDETKRDAVVRSAYEFAPAWFKKLVKANEIDEFVDYVYNAYVKPVAKEKGMTKNSQNKQG